MSAAPSYIPTGKPPINPYVPVQDWGEADLFDAADVPPFPVDALSPWLRDWSIATAEFAQVPVDMPAAIGLGAASLAVARRFKVEVRPGWSEPTNLWIVVAANPAERKSPIFKQATEGVHAYSQKEAERLAPHIRDLELDRHVLTGQLDEAKGKAVKGQPYQGGDARQAARELGDKLGALKEIHVPTLVTDDCTAEALAMVLAQNNERMGILSAEGGPFELMAGRYSDKGTNFEIFLKAHAGDHHIVHRIRREPIFLTQPLLTIALTVQPSVIAGLHAKEGFRGRGLLARFLYSLPQSTVGKRAVESEPVPDEIRNAYNAALVHMLCLAGDERTLTMSSGADAARSRFQGELEPRLGVDGDLHACADWAGKLTGSVCRIAGVLHVADHALDLSRLPDEIPAETFERAATIGGYFLAHAQAAFGLMDADETMALAKKLWAWVQRHGHQQVSERDARRATKSKPEETKAALLKLIERNLIRELPAGGPTGGRPAGSVYAVRSS
jgi:replicative DNA helicase